MELKININKIISSLVNVLVLLIVLHVIVFILLYYQSDTSFAKILKLFHLDEEANFPTFYSSLLFILSSVLLLALGKLKLDLEISNKYWIVLSIIFLFFAVDEIVQLHEKFSNIIYQKFQLGGILRFSWWIIYSFLTITLSIVYLKFLIRLPSQIRKIFIVAAIVFISGSVILEIIGISFYSENDYTKTFSFYLISSIEETLEMTGLIIFIYGLLKYIGLTNQQIIVKIQSAKKG